MKNRLVMLVLVSAVCTTLLGGQAGAQEQRGLNGATVRYTYVFDTNVILGRQETMTTTMTPLPDGRYEVVTTVSTTSSPDEVTISFFGSSLAWLGLSMSEDQGPRTLDLASLISLGMGGEGIQINSNYLLPQGAGLVTRGEVVVAGVVGIEGTYLPPVASEAVITVVLAKDPWLRQFLPFPLSVEIAYPEGGSNTGGMVAQVAAYSGRIVLSEYVYTPPSQ